MVDFVCGLGCHLSCFWLHPTSLDTGVSPKTMSRSPILLLVFAIFSIAALLAQQPTGAQPPTSPTQLQNPSPTNTPQPPVTSPTGVSGTQLPSGTSGNSTLPPAPKSPVEPSPSATAGNPEPPEQPKTEILDTSDTAGALATDGHDPILDPPPFPRGQTTLVGGIISKVDRVRNHLDLAVFGGTHWTINFDERTHIFLNGAQTTQMALKKGQRIYVDTMQDNNKHDIFARNIRLGTTLAPADAAGQIVEVSGGHREVLFRDAIGGETVRFAVASDALISKGSQPASFDDLRPGTLVRVKFAPQRADRGMVKEISILASPGANFIFHGIITFLDTHRGVFAVRSTGDNKTYDLHFVPARVDPERKLGVGAEVQAIANFDGKQYTAQQITVVKPAGSGSSQ